MTVKKTSINLSSDSDDDSEPEKMIVLPTGVTYDDDKSSDSGSATQDVLADKEKSDLSGKENAVPVEENGIVSSTQIRR